MRLLKEFGNVQVLSSPKLVVLNNQTAVLKAIRNIVYFEVDVRTASGTEDNPATARIDTDAPHRAGGDHARGHAAREP